MSLEPPSSQSEIQDSSIDASEPTSEALTFEDSSPAPSFTQPSQPAYRRYGRALLGLGVFTVLSGGILLITQQIKPANSMAGVEGHDMSGMSHDDMMQVDGAFNAVPVTVAVVQAGNFEAGVSYTGSIMPYQEAVVYPRVAGQLTNYSVYPGDRVEAGQVLAELIADERSTALAEASAEANVMQTSLQVSQVEIDEQQQEIARLQAELDYVNLQRDRFAKLTAEGATSQNEYDAVATEVAAQEAALGQAQAKLTRLTAQVTREQARVGQAEARVNTAAVMQGYTTLQAPISGIVQSRMVDPGVVVQPGMGVLKVGDYSRVRLQANVAQKDAGYIRVGTPIRAQVPGATDEPLTGSVTSIFPQTNNDTRTVMVEALIDNPQGRLLSGQYLEMTLLTKSQSNTLSVPQSAVVEYNSEPSVWVMVGTTAERRMVETGMVSSDMVAITSGLNPDDQVITSGYSRLVPGVQVAVVDDTGNPLPMLGDSSQGNVEVAIVEPDSTQSFKSGGADLVIEVRDPDTQEPLPVEDVTVDVTMPMPNMAPMTTMVQFEPTGQPGRFQIKTHFGMVGEWQIKVEVNDPDYKGQALIAVPVE
ncbi:efflux RND transporter periplasmic adaptor subunit [Halomicronema sp. CCY15110]|uniref:efflux RND transporter periplasmic adaptor subunit n=1 Tax=Halomicronema sp. CCY15110 TaxID=2767773 RepID=UPI0019525846|nr:efflux RND transporter periplasmic adaptor subunit [Halomicronema sp. CCY15110]